MGLFGTVVVEGAAAAPERPNNKKDSAQVLQTTTINEYFDEFSGSWEYYALSKRLDFIHEFGSDDENDYNWI